MPPSEIYLRRQSAIQRGTTNFPSDFSYMCSAKPNRIGIVSEGDSWFAYPRKFLIAGKDINVIHHLEQKVKYTNSVNLLRLASSGDEAVKMTQGKQFKELRKILEKNKSHVKMLMFSGGGNDIVGKNDMFPLLNDYVTGMTYRECINQPMFDKKLEEIINAFSKLILLCESISSNIKIITHTYDITTPRNQGSEFLWGLIKTKPWIYPYLTQRNIPKQHHLPIIEYMLETFAQKLIEIARNPATNNRLVVVDTQGTLTLNSDDDWLNEIHPTDVGFKKIFDEIYKEMRKQQIGLPT